MNGSYRLKSHPKAQLCACRWICHLRRKCQSYAEAFRLGKDLDPAPRVLDSIGSQFSAEGLLDLSHDFSYLRVFIALLDACTGFKSILHQTQLSLYGRLLTKLQSCIFNWGRDKLRLWEPNESTDLFKRSEDKNGCSDGSQVDSDLIYHGRRQRMRNRHERLQSRESTYLSICTTSNTYPRNIAEIHQPNYVLRRTLIC